MENEINRLIRFLILLKENRGKLEIGTTKIEYDPILKRYRCYHKNSTDEWNESRYHSEYQGWILISASAYASSVWNIDPLEVNNLENQIVIKVLEGDPQCIDLVKDVIMKGGY